MSTEEVFPFDLSFQPRENSSEGEKRGSGSCLTILNVFIANMVYICSLFSLLICFTPPPTHPPSHCHPRDRGFPALLSGFLQVVIMINVITFAG